MNRIALRLTVALAASFFFVAAPVAKETALDRYVAKPDPNYSYKLVSKKDVEGGTVYVLEMTSQQYLTTNEVDRPIWKHWMVITRPNGSTMAVIPVLAARASGRPSSTARNRALAKC